METNSTARMEVASVRKRRESCDSEENVRLEIASSRALREGMKDLRAEEKAEDMTTSKDARGGGGGEIVDGQRVNIYLGVSPMPRVRSDLSDFLRLPRDNPPKNKFGLHPA